MELEHDYNENLRDLTRFGSGGEHDHAAIVGRIIVPDPADPDEEGYTHFVNVTGVTVDDLGRVSIEVMDTSTRGRINVSIDAFTAIDVTTWNCFH